MHINDEFLCNADYDADKISNFIGCYVVNIPNLAVRNFSWMLMVNTLDDLWYCEAILPDYSLQIFYG